VSSPGWTLELDAENQHLLPWLEGEPDADLRRAMANFLSDLVRAPVGRGLEEVPGVFSAAVRVNFAHDRYGVVVWTLNHERRWVILAMVATQMDRPK
jgi:hypothetical protein